LAWIDEVIGNSQILQSFTDNLFKEFANGIEQDIGVISLRGIIRLLVRFGDDDGC